MQKPANLISYDSDADQMLLFLNKQDLLQDFTQMSRIVVRPQPITLTQAYLIEYLTYAQTK